MTKRKRFIITSVVLSLGFVAMQFLPDQYRIISVILLSLLTLGLFTWSIREGLGPNMTLLTLVLPVMFTLGVGLFWFLLTTSVFTKIPIVIFYGFGIYSLCLTANICTVSAIRTIALLRAARGVGFVLTLITSFLIYDAILSIRVSLPTTSLLVGVSSFPLFMQGLWTVSIEKQLSKELLRLSLISGLIMAEIALSLFFWPVTVVVGSLFFTIAVYILLGLGQARLEARLFAQTVREYLFFGLLVFIGMFIATRWGG